MMYEGLLKSSPFFYCVKYCQNGRKIHLAQNWLKAK